MKIAQNTTHKYTPCRGLARKFVNGSGLAILHVFLCMCSYVCVRLYEHAAFQNFEGA